MRHKKSNLGRRTNQCKNTRNYTKGRKRQSEVCSGSDNMYTAHPPSSNFIIPALIRKNKKPQEDPKILRSYVRLQIFDEIALKKKDPKILRSYISLKRCDESQDEDVTIICLKPRLVPGKNKNSKK